MNTKADGVLPDVKVKREKLVKWDGECPPQYRNTDIDENNPPKGVKAILVADNGGPFRFVYRRPG